MTTTLQDRIHRHRTSATLAAAQQWAAQIVADLRTRSDFVDAWKQMSRNPAENLPNGPCDSWSNELLTSTRQRLASALVARWRQAQVERISKSAKANALESLHDSAYRVGIDLSESEAENILRIQFA